MVARPRSGHRYLLPCGDEGEGCVFGEFGAKFADDISAAPWASVDVVKAPPGELATVEDNAATHWCTPYTQNETSTGVVSPLYTAAPRRPR